MKKRKARPGWTVYIVRCADGSLYTGVTRDIARRIQEHNSRGALAARYTRGRRPVVLVYREAAATRSAACRREYRIKQMTRAGKQELIQATRGSRVVKTHTSPIPNPHALENRSRQPRP